VVSAADSSFEADDCLVAFFVAGDMLDAFFLCCIVRLLYLALCFNFWH